MLNILTVLRKNLYKNNGQHNCITISYWKEVITLKKDKNKDLKNKFKNDKQQANFNLEMGNEFDLNIDEDKLNKKKNLKNKKNK